MDNSLNILHELNGISPIVASINKQMPYYVPENYFENLKFNIFLNDLAESICDNSIKKTQLPYTIPKDYFSSLPNLIISKLRNTEESEVTDELKSISPILNTIDRKELLYTVPLYYFEKLEITKLQTNSNDIKVISLFSLKRSFVRIAIAATFIGLIITTIFTYTRLNTKDDVVIEIKKLSTEELYANLDNNTSSINSSNDNLPTITSDFNSGIQLVSDEELKQYIQEDIVQQKQLLSTSPN